DSRWSDLCFVANLEGAPRKMVPAEHLPAEIAAAKGLRDESPSGGGSSGGWKPLLVTPRLAESRETEIRFDEGVTLANGHGVLFGYDPGSV
ncbi:MAG: hypothetical protein ACOCYQ_04915, partial [Alkalispirochaeta sp.]